METQPITRLELVYQPDPDEEVAMTLAEREGRVTAPKRFMTVSEISKATATRKLAGLVERGILEKRGERAGNTLCAARRERNRRKRRNGRHA